MDSPNLERAIGLETEYALTFIFDTPGGKRFFVPENAADYVLKPAIRMLELPFFNRPRLFRNLLMIKDFADSLWVGKSGGRIYGDQVGHQSRVLEYATPECQTVEGLVNAAVAGDRVLNLISEWMCRRPFDCELKKVRGILISKNNSDLIHGPHPAHSHFFGSHENYEIERAFVWDDAGVQNNRFLRALASLLAARQLLCGVGGLFRRSGNEWCYAISPRALGVKIICGRDIAVDRPMVSFRNAPDDQLSASERLRLHVVVADHNMLSWPLRFRFGLVGVFLKMFESGRLDHRPFPLVSNPVWSARVFSQDVTLRVRTKIEGKRGGWNVVELLQEWLGVLWDFADKNPSGVSEEEKEILKEAILIAPSLRNPDEGALEKVDWLLKLHLLRAYCRKEKIGFSDFKARRFDIYYSDISPTGIFHQWICRTTGRNPFSAKEVRSALEHGGLTPRAEFRKKYVSVFARNGLSLPAHHEWYRFYKLNGKVVTFENPFGKVPAELNRELDSLMRLTKKRRVRDTVRAIDF